MAEEGVLPKGVLPFHQLPISKPQRNQLLVMIFAIITFAILGIMAWISLGLPSVLIGIKITSSRWRK